MSVIQRNLLRLLSSGAFANATDPLEPMSPWKWRRLRSLAMSHGVAALVSDGMAHHSSDIAMQLPADEVSRWGEACATTERANHAANECVAEVYGLLRDQGLRPILLRGQATASYYASSLHRVTDGVAFLLPDATQARQAALWAKDHATGIERGDDGLVAYEWRGLRVEHRRRAVRLANHKLSRRLQSVVMAAINGDTTISVDIAGAEVETLPPSVGLLLAMAHLSRSLMNDGLRLCQLVDLGVMLRAVPADSLQSLQSWVRLLRLRRMSRLEGALLCRLTGFDAAAVPFASSPEAVDLSLLLADILAPPPRRAGSWHFTQGSSVFVKASDPGAMSRQMRHLLRFMPLHPTEASASLLTTFTHSLSHIEE